MEAEPMKIEVKGGGPRWTALVRKADRQVMVAFTGCNEPALGMVEIFLRAAERRIPRSELIVVELNADFDVVEASDIGMRFKLFEAKRQAEGLSDDWIKKGGAS
jgi:hypothetical protein